MKKLEELKNEEFSERTLSEKEIEKIKGGSEKEVTCTPHGNYIDD